jgi:hypothetical protein
MQLTAEDLQRIEDRELLEKLALKPCPLCPSSVKSNTPMIYRTRHTRKWAMRKGFFGCHHSEQTMFKQFRDSAQELADGWNFWVEDNTPKDPQ